LTVHAPVDRIAMIQSRLREALDPPLLEVTDESHLHAGHAGDGRGHSTSDRRPASRGWVPRRHRLIYDALGDLLTTDIHAVRIPSRPDSS
jgi:BolA protein